MAASNGTTRAAAAANCPNASNPYHQCTQACSKKTGRTKSHAKNNVYATSSSSPAAGAPHPPSNFERRKKPQPPSPRPVVPSPNNNHSAVPVSGLIHVNPLPLPDHVTHVQQKDGTEHIIADPIQKIQEDKTASHGQGHHHPGPGEGVVIDFSFAGIIPQSQSNEDKGEKTRVGKYHVKQSFASILQSILDKYGDIGASCDLESVVLRSYYIECVCFVVQELQSDDSSTMRLTKSKINELLAILKDVESAQLSVAWLRCTLDEIAENAQVISQHEELEAEKASSEREMESLREQLESEMETLVQKEQEVADIKKRIPEISDRLKELELKSSQLDQSMHAI